MSMTAQQLLEEAKSLPRAEREKLAEGLIATLGTLDSEPERHLAALRDAVDTAEASVEAGRVTRISSGEMREYLRSRGERATRIVDARRA